MFPLPMVQRGGAGIPSRGRRSAGSYRLDRGSDFLMAGMIEVPQGKKSHPDPKTRKGPRLSVELRSPARSGPGGDISGSMVLHLQVDHQFLDILTKSTLKKGIYLTIVVIIPPIYRIQKHENVYNVLIEWVCRGPLASGDVFLPFAGAAVIDLNYSSNFQIK
jgi:hypothetical protein